MHPLPIDLHGRVAVVTGASRGIGLATARALREAGMEVVAGARTPTAELLDVTPHALAVDLATPSGADELVGHAVATLGRLDLLVNNVGGNPASVAGFLTVDDDQWQRTFDLTLHSAHRAARAALPQLIEHHGAIVGISSANARLPLPPVVAYAAAKAAFTSLGKALALEFGPQGVRVNTISPGPVLTDLWTAPDSAGAALAAAQGLTVEEFVARVPELTGMATGRMAAPEEIARLVVLLASGAVPSINGADLVVDGGILQQV